LFCDLHFEKRCKHSPSENGVVAWTTARVARFTPHSQISNRLSHIAELANCGAASKIVGASHDRGGMAEWLKAAVLKRFLGVFAKPLKLNIIPLPAVF
jgi:hypothetical protein